MSVILIIERKVRLSEEIGPIDIGGLLSGLLEFAENQAELQMCAVSGNTKQWPIRRLEF